MPIIITSRRDGFRRCGIEHPAKPVEYPDNKFTKEQLQKLQAEPMLVVQIIGTQDGNEDFIEGRLDPAQLETMKLDDLRKLAEEMQLQVSSKITKKELVELIANEPVNVEEDEVNASPKGGETK